MSYAYSSQSVWELNLKILLMYRQLGFARKSRIDGFIRLIVRMLGKGADYVSLIFE